MWKKPFKFAYLIFQKQRIIYSALALFMALSLALSPQNQIPAAAQANLPVFSLSANCTPDAQGTFTISNIGSDMTGPGSYTLLLNGTPIATGSFQLNGGASTTVNTSGLYGTLELDASGGGSVGTATVSTFCQSPTATPTLTPPTISLSANCTVDAQGTFTLSNIGSDMTGPGSYTLLLNGTPIATNSFQLNGGASTTVHTSGLYGTLELDASGGGSVGTATVSTFCQSPTSTPTLTPMPTLAPPTISLSANCTPDAQGTFTISNIGSDMTGPGSYTLLLNGTPIATGSFQLNGGSSTTINTSGLYGTLELDVSGGGSVGTATVSTFCQSPTATPTPTPPTISLSANCTVDAQGTFTISNIGSDMTGPGSYTLLLNGTPIATNSFQLNAGASTTVHTSGLYGTLELDASGGGSVGTATVSTFCQSPTSTPTITPSVSVTPTTTITPTSSLTPTNTPIATSTRTPTATSTPSDTRTGTLTATRTPTMTRTGTLKATKTPTKTSTHAFTATHRPYQTSTGTLTREPTRRGTYKPTKTSIPTLIHSLTPTPTRRKDYHPTAKGTHVHYYTLTPRPTKTHREDDSKSNSKKLKASGISAEIGKGGSVPINWFNFLVQSLTRIWLSLLVFGTVLAIRLR